ncbi:MAG: HPr family phosphocarrier protein [Rhodospirillaceae bacterium]|nr:HPr family phosphocarrier protein [Rhodospirillaceae bacterium]
MPQPRSDEAAASGRSEASTTITHPTGLHARPAVKLTQLAATFASAVSLRVGDAAEWVDAKSIVKVMRLKARPQSVLHLRAVGPDAEEAVRSLVALVERDFDERAG